MNKSNRIARKIGLEGRREKLEKEAEILRKEISELKKTPVITWEKQKEIRKKLNEVLNILGFNRETSLLYKERELQRIKELLK